MAMATLTMMAILQRSNLCSSESWAAGTGVNLYIIYNIGSRTFEAAEQRPMGGRMASHAKHLRAKPRGLRERADLQARPAGEARDRRARAADTCLHGLITDRCGNPRLAAEIRRYLTLFRALRNVSHLHDSWTDYRRSNDVPEHIEIVNALVTG